MKMTSPSLVGWFQKLSSTKRTLLTILGLCTGLLLLSWGLGTPNHRVQVHGLHGNSTSVASQEQIDAEMKTQWERIRSNSNSKTLAPAPSAFAGKIADSSEEPGAYATPLIAHAADLELTTKEFSKSRTSLENILDRHHGYAAKLRMVGQPAGSLLTATLRVPSSEFGDTVNELKGLGNVQREEQTADEITQHRADLEARLSNAQNSLARLQGILAKGGKVKDLEQVQRELSNVSGEIARLEAERLAAEHRVIFSQVLFSMREEVAQPADSLAAQFHSAAVAGFSDALGTVSAIAIFAISRGPVLLLWVVLIYFPVRWAWRKWRLATGASATA